MENKTIEQTKWEKVEAEVFKFEKIGDAIEGFLIEKRDKGGKFDNESYVIENEKGFFVVFSTEALGGLLKLVKVEDYLRIMFKETIPSDKGNDIKIFQVDRKKFD